MTSGQGGVPTGRWVCKPAAMLYSAVTSTRNGLYNHHWLRTKKAQVPVISVGNLTVGGTGKTPIIEYLLRWGEGQGLRCGVISRGYKSHVHGSGKVEPKQQDAYYGDEPTMLAQKFPQVPVYIGKDRWTAAQELTRHHRVDVIFADDAFQHRRLKRELDVVVIDAMSSPSDYELLPLGRARESLMALKRSDFVVFNKVNLANKDRLQLLQQFLQQFPLPPADHRVEVSYKIEEIFKLNDPQECQKPSTVKAALLVSGIGRPAAFEASFPDEMKIVAHHAYRDHFWYSEREVDMILATAMRLNASHIITTEKDSVKLQRFSKLAEKLYVAPLTLKASPNIDHLLKAIANHVAH